MTLYFVFQAQVQDGFILPPTVKVLLPTFRISVHKVQGSPLSLKADADWDVCQYDFITSFPQLFRDWVQRVCWERVEEERRVHHLCISWVTFLNNFGPSEFYV